MRSVMFLSPTQSPAGTDSIESLLTVLRGRRFAALSGAGCSTDSGIPDYRGPQGMLRRRQPITYQEFLRSEVNRRRYWARSMVGWSTVAAARPNAAHLALVELERAGCLAGLITQNVDGLHHAAGSQRLVELHGNLHFIRCLSCSTRITRAAMQAELQAENPTLDTARAESAPDGDAELAPEYYEDFIVPVCKQCGGLLKPDVVFFGENVLRPVVDAAWSFLAEAEVLLILGSSLAVYSGYRFVVGAAQRKLPVAIVNLGPTRGDELATIRIAAPLGPTLTTLATQLT